MKPRIVFFVLLCYSAAMTMTPFIFGFTQWLADGQINMFVRAEMFAAASFSPGIIAVLVIEYLYTIKVEEDHDHD